MGATGLGGICIVWHAYGGDDQRGNRKDLDVHRPVCVADALYRVLNPRYLRSASEHSLSHVKRKAKQILGKIILVYFSFFQFFHRLYSILHRDFAIQGYGTKDNLADILLETQSFLSPVRRQCKSV